MCRCMITLRSFEEFKELLQSHSVDLSKFGKVGSKIQLSQEKPENLVLQGSMSRKLELYFFIFLPHVFFSSVHMKQTIVAPKSVPGMILSSSISKAFGNLCHPFIRWSDAVHSPGNCKVTPSILYCCCSRRKVPGLNVWNSRHKKPTWWKSNFRGPNDMSGNIRYISESGYTLWLSREFRGLPGLFQTFPKLPLPQMDGFPFDSSSFIEVPLKGNMKKAITSTDPCNRFGVLHGSYASITFMKLYYIHLSISCFPYM